MKRDVLLVCTVLLFALFNHVSAQVNIGGAPVSWSESAKAAIAEDIVPFVVTPELDMEAIREEDERDNHMPMKIGRRFGIEHDVDIDLHNSGVWSCLPDGGKLWRYGIECPGALSINLIFDNYLLPPGAALYLFAEDKSDVLGGFTDYNNQEDRYFATSVVLSDKIIIEYYQPANVPFEGTLHLEQIVHGYRGPGEHKAGEKAFGGSGYCQRNTICPEGEGWEDQIRSVFALYSGGSELCSGAIVNNTAEDGKPYALTANHCWEAYSNPGTWVFRFGWESPTCTPTTNSSYQTMSGSTLRMRTNTNTSSTDCCLVELNQPIPEEYNVYYAGWSRSLEPSPLGMCIHHPDLDIKKLSPSHALYTVTQYVRGWRADWSTGACTEGGSSGSPLFDVNGRIVGQEYGGGSYCGASSSNMFDVYGRFDVSWEGSSSSNRLKDWLDPLGLDSEYLNGLDPYAIAHDARIIDVLDVDDLYYYIQKIQPSVVIQNNGSQNLTQATISYSLNGSSPVSVAWEGDLGKKDTAEVVFPAFTPEYGAYTITFTITIPEDEDSDNNTLERFFEVRNCIFAEMPFEEGFEHDGAMPECIQNIAIKGEEIWKIVTTGENGSGNPSDPYSGSYNARYYGANQGEAAKMLFVLDLSSLEFPLLTFWYAQGKRVNNDYLRVLFKRSSEDEEWALLGEYRDAVSEWTQETILLPPTNNICVLAFEGYSQNGHGVAIDEIVVKELPACLPVVNLSAEFDENLAHLSWEAPSEEVDKYKVYRDETLIAILDNDRTSFSAAYKKYKNFCIIATYNYQWCEESTHTCLDVPIVGIDAHELNDIRVYPNPAHSQLLIEGKAIKSVDIYNLNGQWIDSKEQFTGQAIDVSHYAPGYYLIKITTEQGNVMTKQVQIIH
ncbi:MAG: T9SS type A sorting domain-containing protein [Bacteroidales bacterium]|jgi:hypothetical protein|nr:T9SS type A sorting domain-containing protein [Bacteroidales bacterium]